MIPLLLVYKCQIIGKFPNISHALGTFYLLFIFLDHLEVLFMLINSLIKKKKKQQLLMSYIYVLKQTALDGFLLILSFA